MEATATLTLLQAIALASGLQATTYGHGENFCGDIGKPVACAVGAVTASGDGFDPEVASAAVAAPLRLRVNARMVWLRVDGGPCVGIRLNDKMNPRWMGVRGFDLTPAAVELLTGKPAHKHWSEKVFVCNTPPNSGRPSQSVPAI